MVAPTARRPFQVWLDGADCDLAEFRALVEVVTDPADYPHADTVQSNVVVYGERLRETIADGSDLRDVMAELVDVLMDGPGIAVFKGAFADTTVIDRSSEAFAALIEEQKAGGVTGGDHFAPPGANDRFWGALGKLACAAPRCSPTTSPTTSWRWSRGPGSARTTR